MIFDSFFAERPYDKPTIDSKFAKQGSQGKKMCDILANGI